MVAPHSCRLAQTNQRHGTELRTRTLASIKPEITQALTSLLNEIRSSEDARDIQFKAKTRPACLSPAFDKQQCPLCKQVGHSNFRHFVSECTHQKKTDVIWRKYDRSSNYMMMKTNRTRQYMKSPNAEVVGSEHPKVQKIANMISHSTTHKLGCVTGISSQSAHQADGSSPVSINCWRNLYRTDTWQQHIHIQRPGRWESRRRNPCWHTLNGGKWHYHMPRQTHCRANLLKWLSLKTCVAPMLHSHSNNALMRQLANTQVTDACMATTNNHRQHRWQNPLGQAVDECHGYRVK